MLWWLTEMGRPPRRRRRTGLYLKLCCGTKATILSESDAPRDSLYLTSEILIENNAIQHKHKLLIYDSYILKIKFWKWIQPLAFSVTFLVRRLSVKKFLFVFTKLFCITTSVHLIPFFILESFGKKECILISSVLHIFS